TSFGITRIAAASSEVTSAFAVPAQRNTPPRIAQTPERKGFRFTVRIAPLLSTIRENPATAFSSSPARSEAELLRQRHLVDLCGGCETIALPEEVERYPGEIPLCVGAGDASDAQHATGEVSARSDGSDPGEQSRRTPNGEGEWRPLGIVEAVDLEQEEVVPAGDGLARRENLLELVVDLELHRHRRRHAVLEVLVAGNQREIGDGGADEIERAAAIEDLRRVLASCARRAVRIALARLDRQPTGARTSEALGENEGIGHALGEVIQQERIRAGVVLADLLLRVSRLIELQHVARLARQISS